MRSLRVFSASLCLVVTTGCSLVNPHVRWDKPTASTLDAAMKYAADAKERYKEAVGDQAMLTNMLGIGLIPLGAATLGLAATGGSTTAITALGLAGAAGFTTGTWLSSRPRQLVYIEGIKALTCAVDAVRPLSTVPLGDLDAKLRDLNSAIGDVQAQIIVVRGKLAALPTTPSAASVTASAVARSDLTAAEKAIADAVETLGAGYALKQHANGVGIALIQAVDRIGAEVDRALVATLPDLQNLPAVIGGLAQLSTQFGAVGIPQTPPMGGRAAVDERHAVVPDPVQELLQALEQLKQKVADLGVRARIVAIMVNNVGAAKSLESLKQCNVADVATGLTIEPTALIFKAGADATKTVVISGGKPPYFAETLDDPMEGLTVRPPGLSGARVDVIGKKPTEGGPYTILVRDTAGQSRRVTVTVGPATPKKDEPSAIQPGARSESGPPAGGAGGVEATDTERAKVRAVLCAAKDAPWDGAAMKDAIRVYQDTVKTKDADVTGTLTRTQIDNLVKRKDCKPNRRNFAEDQLTAARIKQIQAKVGMTPSQQTGELTPATRTAIRAFKMKAFGTDEDFLRAGEDDKILKAPST